jgi:flagellar hook-associated protein 2
VLSSLGLVTAEQMQAHNGTQPSAEELAKAGTKQDGSNAIIELNGAQFVGESNKFSINGLEITATGVSDKMTVTTTTDTDAIYDMIKSFFSEYNTLVNAMETAYNADSSKGYEPLTDDEKDEMSDTEVEKWETKIKDSLLRRDSTLNTVLTSMSMSASKTYEVNGKTYSLSSFGIATAGYFTRVENESYALHIDGDEDDSVSSSNSDKLRAAIEADPDTVAEFFTQFAKDMYDTLDTKMKSTTLSSSYTVYNDKELQSEYDDYTDLIDDWETRLEDLEDYYYDKFSSMETALGTLQSQTSSLTSLLGS